MPCWLCPINRRLARPCRSFILSLRWFFFFFFTRWMAEFNRFYESFHPFWESVQEMVLNIVYKQRYKTIMQQSGLTCYSNAFGSLHWEAHIRYVAFARVPTCRTRTVVSAWRFLFEDRWLTSTQSPMEGPFCGGMNFFPSHTRATSRPSKEFFSRRSPKNFFWGAEGCYI